MHSQIQITKTLPPPQLENVAVKIYEADQDQDQDI